MMGALYGRRPLLCLVAVLALGMLARGIQASCPVGIFTNDLEQSVAAELATDVVAACGEFLAQARQRGHECA